MCQGKGYLPLKRLVQHSQQWGIMKSGLQQKSEHTQADLSKKTTFEIFVRKGFSSLEVSSVTAVLSAANGELGDDRFSWRFVSDTPGLVKSDVGLIARAEPVVFDHGLKECLVVVGGGNTEAKAFMPRVRAMERQRRAVILLSEAAAAFIEKSRTSGSVATTHWRQVQILREMGCFLNVTTKLSETDGCIKTSAGSGFTTELMMSTLEGFLPQNIISEITRRLVLQSPRDGQSDQPTGPSHFLKRFGEPFSNSIKLMEENISDPLSINVISNEVGLSVRQLERLFKKNLGISPTRYYKGIRVSAGHVMVTETSMKIVEIAFATGFGSAESFSTAYLEKYGTRPSRLRSTRQNN